MDAVLGFIATASLYGSIVGLLILIIKQLFKKQFTASFHFFIWSILILKLIIPFGPETRISIFNVITPPAAVLYDVSEQISGRNGTMNIRPDTDAVPEKSSSTAMQIAAVIWVAGVVTILAWSGISMLIFKRAVARSRKETDAHILDLLTESKKIAKIKADIGIITQSHINTPALYGFISPKILLPFNAGELSDKDIRFALLHELAHFKRKDIFVGYLLTALEAIHWFNPVLWYLFHKIRQDMELAADEKAMLWIGAEHCREYGKSLIAIAENCKAANGILKLVCMADGNKNLKNRIKRIAKFRKKKGGWILCPVLVFIMAGTVCLTDAKSIMAYDGGTQIDKQAAADIVTPFTTPAIADNETEHRDKEGSGTKSGQKEDIDPTAALSMNQGEASGITKNISSKQTDKDSSKATAKETATEPTKGPATEPVAEPANTPLPNQPIRSEKASDKIKLEVNRLLPGTNMEHIQKYLDDEGKTKTADENYRLSNSYSIVTTEGTKTIRTDNEDRVTVYAKSTSTEMINITLSEKSSGKIVANANVSPKTYCSYSFVGLAKNTEYEISVKSGDDAESTILIY